MIRRRRLIVVAPLVFVLTIIVGWALLYPDSSDPKNIKYVLWKSGLYRMDTERVIAPMVGDPDRDELVVGKTREQLRERFGHLSTLSEATDYLKTCYQGSSWKGRDVLFIGQSPWMIVFEGDRAASLVLIKGC